MKQFFTKYRDRLLTGVIVVMALLNYLSYQAGVGQGEPVAVDAPLRPTTALTVPPKPTRGATLTPTKVPATSTPVPTNTPVPPTPTGTVFPPIACLPHPNAWHAPADEPCQHHHHGDNPRLYASVFSDGGFDLNRWLDENGELYQPAWLSSATEDPRGMIWLYQHTDTCQLFNNGGELDTGSFGCVTDFLFRVHDVGTAEHMVNRFHSYTMIVRACNQLPGEKPGVECGILATGGLADYGILETPYKNAHCALANDPPGFTDLNQPPYRANQTADRGDLVQYWNGLHPNAIQAAFYPHDPNALIGVAWNSTDAYHVWDVEGCGLATVDEAKAAALLMPQTKYLHANFHVFTVMVYPVPGSPFTGYVDQWGHPQPEGECVAVSNICIPLTISGQFPAKALYNQQVDNTVPGPNDYSSPLLLPPWLDTAP